MQPRWLYAQTKSITFDSSAKDVRNFKFKSRQRNIMVIDWSNFFAMRSCEYCLKTAAEEKKRTKIVRIGNITFKKKNKILSHSSKELEKADLVRVRFSFQKNDKCDVCVHMFLG